LRSFDWGRSESSDGRSRLEATFLGEGVICCPGDVSAGGLENISYRVAEGEGFFAF
jgi:hypothetical protein